MNLKDAFRFKHVIHDMIDEACRIMMSRETIYDVSEQHLKSQVIATEKDETITVCPTRKYSMNAAQVFNFIQKLMNEYQLLSLKIDMAMSRNIATYKAMLDVTRQVRAVANSLNHLTTCARTERQEVGAATYINAAGDASSYTYPKKIVSTPTFNVEELQEALKNLLDQADKNSNELEKKLIETEVDYQPKFSVNDSFAAIAKKLDCAA